MNRNLAILLCYVFISSLDNAKGYVVDGDNGNDNNNGETINDPFKTIARCVEALSNPGDECLIREGNYHEVVTVSGLQGMTTIQNIFKQTNTYVRVITKRDKTRRFLFFPHPRICAYFHGCLNHNLLIALTTHPLALLLA